MQGYCPTIKGHSPIPLKDLFICFNMKHSIASPRFFSMFYPVISMARFQKDISYERKFKELTGHKFSLDVICVFN